MYLVDLQKCILCICHGCYPTDLSVIAPPPPSEGFLCHLTLLIIVIFNILTVIIHSHQHDDRQPLHKYEDEDDGKKGGLVNRRLVTC